MKPITINKKLQIFIAGAIILSLMVLIELSAIAAVPKVITFQGVLTDTDGKAVSGAKIITFNIYDAATGGTSLLTAPETVSLDSSGIYNVEIDVSGLSFDTQYWLGITVAGDSEMTPRFKITSSGYAIRADDSDTLNGQTPSYYLDYNNLTNAPSPGAANLDIQLGDVSISTPTSQIDFNSSHFDVTESPAGEANVSITTAPYAAVAASIDSALDGSGSGLDADLLDGKNYDAFLSTSGGSLSGIVAMGSNKITNLADPTSDQDAATKIYVDNQTGGGNAAILNSTQTFTGQNTFQNQVTISSDIIISGTLDMRSNKITNLVDPTNPQDAATRQYVLDQTGSGNAAVLNSTQTFTGKNTFQNMVTISSKVVVNVTSGGAAEIGSSANSATGDHAVAMGDDTTASGYASTAMGNSSTASGNQSTAMGLVSIASGASSTAMGRDTIASGNRSTAMGLLSTASGNQSTAMGYNTTASGEYSTAMGRDTSAVGDYSFAAGRLSSATAQGAFAISDSQTAVFSVTTADSFGARFAGGYNLTGGGAVFQSTVTALAFILTNSATRYYSVPPAAFNAAKGNTGFGDIKIIITDVELQNNNEITQPTTYYAPVHLPDDAVIDEVTLFYNDAGTVAGGTIDLKLLRKELSTGGAATEMAAVNFVGVGAIGTIGSVSDSTVSNNSVNNGTYFYTLKLIISMDIAGKEIWCHGASIKYFVNNPLP